MSVLKDKRLSKNITQKDAAKALGISLRSYISYENDPSKEHTIKYRYLLNEFDNKFKIDEDNGILSLNDIINISSSIFKKYDIDYCYLFGSYAKGNASDSSDIDLLISSGLTGLRFYSLAEELREALRKKIDLLDVKQLNDNEALLDEILRDGIKIYG